MFVCAQQPLAWGVAQYPLLAQEITSRLPKLSSAKHWTGQTEIRWCCIYRASSSDGPRDDYSVVFSSLALRRNSMRYPRFANCLGSHRLQGVSGLLGDTRGVDLNPNFSDPEQFFLLPSAALLGGRKGKGCQNRVPRSHHVVSQAFHHGCYHRHRCEQVSSESSCNLISVLKTMSGNSRFLSRPAFPADRPAKAKVNSSSGISLPFTTYLLSGMFAHPSSSMWFALAEEEAGPK